MCKSWSPELMEHSQRVAEASLPSRGGRISEWDACQYGWGGCQYERLTEAERCSEAGGCDQYSKITGIAPQSRREWKRRHRAPHLS